MSEWHLTPEYILESMTDEEWTMYWQKRNERIVAINQVTSPRDSGSAHSSNRRVSDMELFKIMRDAPRGIVPQGNA